MGVVEILKDKLETRQRAEALIKRWQRECLPMCDPVDLERLEILITQEFGPRTDR